MPKVDSTKQYWQNLLKIEVPVQVTLASKRIPVRTSTQLHSGGDDPVR